MALMVDRGDSYQVEYLGSAMLTQMATGIGVLQKPLRDLYFRYKQNGKNCVLQERILTMTAQGMRITFQTGGGNGNRPVAHEMFYAMPSILLWDAVRFVAVRGHDKKIKCAFEPLDNDHSRNKDNLFSSLEKKFSFLQQMTHPPMFTCVLRRTQGVKALDVHAFVCHSEEQALGLVRALSQVQRHCEESELQESGVFGYNPFSGSAERRPQVDQGYTPHIEPANSHDPNPRQILPQNQYSQDRVPPQVQQKPRNVQKPGSIPLPGLQNQSNLSKVSSNSCVQLTQGDFTPDNSRPFTSYQVDEDAADLRQRASRYDLATRAEPRNMPNRVPSSSHQERNQPRHDVAKIIGPKGDEYSVINRPSVGATPSGFKNSDRSERDGSPTGYSRSISRTIPRSTSPGRPTSISSMDREKRVIDRFPSAENSNSLQTSSLEDRSKRSGHDPVAPSASNAGPAAPKISQSSRALFGGDNSSEAPNRPVAMVPPRKVQGIKVLPTPVAPRTEPTLSPTKPPQTSGEEFLSQRVSSVPNMTSQQGSNSNPRQSNRGYRAPDTAPSGGSQQFPQSKGGKSETSSEQSQESLLLSQKKDAEIAAVVQNLRFDYESNTISPHGTNFEKSLGYFP